jgi:hypothetical protein
MVNLVRVVVALVVLSVATALASGKPETTKLLIEVKKGQGIDRELLDRFEAEIIGEYDAFTAVRVPEPALDGLQQAVAARQFHSEHKPEWDTIALRRGTIDTRREPGRPLQLGETAGLYVIQFTAPLTVHHDEKLQRHGANYIGYLPHNAALVVGTPASFATLSNDPDVQWTSAYDSTLRAQPGAFFAGATEMIVQFANVPSSKADVTRFRDSHSIIQEVAYGRYVNFRVLLTGAEAEALLHAPFITSLEYPGADRLSGEREAISQTTPRADSPTTTVYQWFRIGANYEYVWEPFRPGSANYRDWIPSVVRTNAANYRIAIADSGLDNGGCGTRHPDIYNNMIFTDYMTPGGCAADNVGHGTMVTGLALAKAAARNNRCNLVAYGLGRIV